MNSIDIYFSLGSNIGDRVSNIRKAVSMMDEAFGTVHSAVSEMYETEPWGFVSGNRFINCCVLYSLCGERGEAMADCLSILRECQRIETALGRVRPDYGKVRGEKKYADRTIDIDILFYGHERIEVPDLTVPHPLMSVRDFVMTPLRSIAKADIKEAFPEIFD